MSGWERVGLVNKHPTDRVFQWVVNVIHKLLAMHFVTFWFFFFVRMVAQLVMGLFEECVRIFILFLAKAQADES